MVLRIGDWVAHTQVFWTVGEMRQGAIELWNVYGTAQVSHHRDWDHVEVRFPNDKCVGTPHTSLTRICGNCHRPREQHTEAKRCLFGASSWV